jgi:predicted component of type VI protein secretion system
MVRAVPRESICDMNVAPVNLVLELVAREGQTLEGEPRKVFGAGGGRIGRASDCEWVLRSPYISRYHATVCCIDGVFCILSTGENGVALNDAQAGLPQLEHRALQDGDRIFIDEYEIAVAFEPGSVAIDFTATNPSLRTAFGLDPLRKSTPDVLTAERQAPLPDAAWNHSSGLADHFAPPPVGPTATALPEDWDGGTNLPALERVAPPTSSGAFDLTAFLRGAGIEPDGLSPEIAGTLGRMLRSLVQGLIEVLNTRAEFRNQFRLPVTRVKTSENNPLKFAVDADDALASLLRKRADRYLGPLEAVADGFDDIRTHHLAMVVGMRAGCQCVLNRFDPKTLATEFDRRARRNSWWPVPAGRRYWRQYVDLFETLTGDAESAFQRLFGEEFARAYEGHLESARRQRGTPPNATS